MTFDGHTNFASSQIAVAPSPSNSGLSLGVTPGTGGLFSSVPCNAFVFPEGTVPAAQTTEIVRVTGVVNDTLTIVRSQEGTSVRQIQVGDAIVAGPTVKTFTDIENTIMVETARALAAEATLQPLSNKDQPSGYAGLDSGGLLKVSELPPSVVTGRLNVPHLAGFGHSLVEGYQPSLIERDGYFSKVAQVVGAQMSDNFGMGGAILCHANKGAAGDGGWAYMLNIISPAYRTGSAPYVPFGCSAIFEYLINDIPQLGSNNMVPAYNALRACLSRFYSCRICEETDGSWAFVGTWSHVTGGGSPHYPAFASSGNGIQISTTAGDTATWTVPADYPAGSGLPVALGMTVAYGDSLPITITHNGATVLTTTLGGAAMADPNGAAQTLLNAYCPRFGIPGDGITIAAGDTFVITVGSGSGTLRVDYAQMEANHSNQCVGVVLPHTLVSPALGGGSIYAGYPFGPSAGTNPLTNAGIRSVVAAMKVWLAAEFPQVVAIDQEPAFGQNFPLMFYTDGVHPNDWGHQAKAQLTLDAMGPQLSYSSARMRGGRGSIQRAWRLIGGGYGSSGAYATDVNLPAFGTHFGSVSGQSVGYKYLPATGEVQLRGQLTYNTTFSYPATAFVLPVGMRPNRTLTYFCETDSASGVPATLTVDTGGNVKVTANGSTTLIGLDHVRFFAED